MLYLKPEECIEGDIREIRLEKEKERGTYIDKGRYFNFLSGAVVGIGFPSMPKREIVEKRLFEV